MTPEERDELVAAVAKKIGSQPYWAYPDSITAWARRFRVPVETMKRLLADGVVESRTLSERRVQIALKDVPKE